MPDHDQLIRLSAVDMRRRLAGGEITPLDALDALEVRIGEVEPRVNALPTLCFERARERARGLMRAAPDRRGLLAGLPIAIKDLTAVAGVRTTFGSRMHEHFVPERSDNLVEHLERNGAVVYAKSNTPEFGAGGHTFNDVFGVTRNPHDTSLSAGGSSGGSAAALAAGTAWLATGSDMAGSLRTPAAFCGVASLRPSPGLIAADPGPLPFEVLAAEGPMARSLEDVALLADAMAGVNHRAGLSKPAPAVAFLDAARTPRRPARIAFSADLGVTETAPEILAVCQAAAERLAGDGVEVVDDHPDLSQAHDAFATLRALSYAAGLGADLERTRDVIKPEVVWNVEQGLTLDGDAIRAARLAQGELFAHAAAFMEDYDLLVCPATAIAPFPVEERYPGAGAGVPVAEYYRWLAIVYAITMTTLPVITLPCGRAPGGLPVGLQLVGRPHGEAELFSFARHVEDILGWDVAPVDPR